MEERENEFSKHCSSCGCRAAVFEDSAAASTLYRRIVFPIFEMNCKDLGIEFRYSLLIESGGSAVGIKRCILVKGDDAVISRRLRHCAQARKILV